MSLANHYQLSALLTAILNLILALLVVKKGFKRKLVRQFTLYCSSIIFWSFFVTLATTEKNQQLALLYSQLCHVGATLIPVFFLHFVHTFLGLSTRNLVVFILDALSGTFIPIILFFPSLFFDSVSHKLGFPFFPNPGGLYTSWMALFFTTVLFVHYKLLQAFLCASGVKRKQLRFFFLANLLGYSGGIGCFLPVYNLAVFPYPYGSYGVVFFSLVTAYSILKHKFLDIEVIIKKTLVFTGLFASVVGTISLVVYLLNTYVADFVGVSNNLSTIIAIVIAMLVYDPVKTLLVHLTDRYLFQKKEDIRKILNRLSNQIITILDLETVGKTILSTLQNSLRLETGAILVKDENGSAFPILEHFGFKPREEWAGEKGEEKFFPTEHPLIRFFSEHDQLVNLENEEERRALPEAVRVTLEQMGTHLAMPLFIHNELIGILTLGKKKSDEEFKRDETDYFPTLSGQTAIAISNARLYDILKKSEIDFAQQAKMAAIGTLSAGIGHEIKNPLAAIKTGVEMIRFNKKFGVYNNLDKAQYEAIVDDVIERVLHNVDRAAGVIDRLSSFAKKPKEIKIESVNLEECANAALSLLKKEFEHYNIFVKKEFPPNFPHVLADRVQMEEIFLNLFVNARHAIKEKGQIVVTASCTNGEIEVSIQDTGDGIPKENLEKIFDPFFTTKDVSRNPDKEAIKGTGLGLFLVREFIKKFGGRITVESESNRGTTFHIFLKQAA